MAVSISQLSKAVRDFRTGLSHSLPDYLKTTNIMSKVYIENTLYEEDVLLPLMGMLNQLYCAYVLTALQMNQYVQSNRTVRDLLEVVATDALEYCVESIMGGFGSNDDNTVIYKTEDIISLDKKEQMLFSGRVVEIEMGVPGASRQDPSNPNSPFQLDNKVNMQQIKISIIVQLLPYLITSDVAEETIKLNLDHSYWVRFKQAKAKEISWIWDFFMERDIINDKRKALKEDKTGLLYEMLQESSNSLSRALMSYIGILPRNHNIANSILIVNESSFRNACRNRGVDFNRDADRNRFFRESMMMFLVIVDPLHSRITMYFNGLDRVGNYNFKQIMSMVGAGTKGSDKYDLQSIMAAFGQGMVPKF